MSSRQREQRDRWRWSLLSQDQVVLLPMSFPFLFPLSFFSGGDRSLFSGRSLLPKTWQRYRLQILLPFGFCSLQLSTFTLHHKALSVSNYLLLILLFYKHFIIIIFEGDFKNFIINHREIYALKITVYFALVFQKHIYLPISSTYTRTKLIQII